MKTMKEPHHIYSVQMFMITGCAPILKQRHMSRKEEGGVKMGKFKSGFVDDIRKESEHDKEQQIIREKYHIEETPDKLIVVKGNYIKTIAGIIHTVFNIIFFILAVIGLAAIIYPETREALIHQMQSVYTQLKLLLF